MGDRERTVAVRKSSTLSTGLMAEYLGLSPQALHWYEAQGLVKPQRVGTYRRYSSDDLCLLSRVRFYHQCGFSTDETARLLEAGLDGIEGRLGARIGEAERELRIEQEKLACLKRNAELVRRCEGSPAAFSQVRTEALYFRTCYALDGGTLTFEGSPLKAWTDCIPLARYALVVPDAFGAGARELTGIMLAKDLVALASDEVRADVRDGAATFHGPVEALYGTTSFLGPIAFKKIARGLVERAGADVRDMRGDLVACPITCHREGGAVRTYWEAWIPLA